MLWFLGRVRTELKTDAFRECEDRAYRWVMDCNVKEFFWRDQGHHSPCMVPPFQYKGRAPNYFALYLLECAPAESRSLPAPHEVCRRPHCSINVGDCAEITCNRGHTRVDRGWGVAMH